MKYIQCPNTLPLEANENALFMAVGISGCADWQSELAQHLHSSDWVLLDPRREHFDTSNSSLAEEQIL